MTVKIQRGRQFLAGDVTAQLFDDQGRAGTYLTRASEKLVAQANVLVLQKGAGTLRLATADDWRRFLSDEVGTKEKTADFAKKFGITFDDFCNVVDDLAASDDKGLWLDLAPNTALSKALSLDKVRGNYATAMKTPVPLSGPRNARSVATLVPSPSLGPELLTAPIDMGWERDRTEQEAWADFVVLDGANRIFRETSAIAVFEKLTQPSWKDVEAMALVNQFTLPLHLEQRTRRDGTTSYQDKDEMFRETYFDDASGALERAGASVRVRVRFDDEPPFEVRRVLIQGKEDREIDAEGNSRVRKFEKRFEGTYVADEAKAHDLLLHGKDTDGSALEVAALLYKTLHDKRTLPADQQLRLEPKLVILQKRRRSHLQLASVSDVQQRRAALKTERAAFEAKKQPVPMALQRFDVRLAEQEMLLTEASELLRRHGQYLASNTDFFIISADRYSVYDPAARTTLPDDIDDAVGRVGRGLHLEAEWDSASSDSFEKALQSLEQKLAAAPRGKSHELERDRSRLQEISRLILKDVETAVELMRNKLQRAGLRLDDRHLSKEERGRDFMRRPQRPIVWQ